MERTLLFNAQRQLLTRLEGGEAHDGYGISSADLVVVGRVGESERKHAYRRLGQLVNAKLPQHIPCFFKLVSWIRANDLQMMATPPK